MNGTMMGFVVGALFSIPVPARTPPQTSYSMCKCTPSVTVTGVCCDSVSVDVISQSKGRCGRDSNGCSPVGMVLCSADVDLIIDCGTYIAHGGGSLQSYCYGVLPDSKTGDCPEEGGGDITVTLTCGECYWP